MNKIKRNYLKILDEYIDEKLFITNDIHLLEKEIDENCWWIDGTKKQILSLSKLEWINFFDRLIENRKAQLQKSKTNIDLLFYCWHDQQARQLRFNLINSNHQKLPFGSKIIKTSLEEVLDLFLNDENFGFFPFEELEDTDFEGNERLKPLHILKVYCKKLFKSEQ